MECPRFRTNEEMGADIRAFLAIVDELIGPVKV